MKPKGIVIHCSYSPQGRGDNAETIHQWHLERNFSGLGYHYVILEDGTIENGRPEFWEGAHANGYNDYLGICLIGDYSFTDIQFAQLANLCDRLRKKYKFVDSQILGHYQVSKKTCPNFNVDDFKTNWLNKKQCNINV
jgi:N-acetyl-anhydromuramyl-L-alanine amidase AmpD